MCLLSQVSYAQIYEAKTASFKEIHAIDSFGGEIRLYYDAPDTDDGKSGCKPDDSK